jgi:hypothetical protein
MIFALRRLRKKSSLGLLVRWCNGNTAPFGGVIHGSNPCRTANLANKNDGLLDVCTKLAKQPARPADRRVKFPVTIQHRSSKAMIYTLAGKFAFLLCSPHTAAGKRRMQTFAV